MDLRDLGAAIQSQYLMFQAAISNAYFSRAVPGNGVSPAEIMSLEIEARRHLISAKGQINLAIDTAINDVLLTVPDSELRLALHQELETRAISLLAQLGHIMSANVSTVVRLARGTALSGIQRVDGKAGAIGALIQKRASVIDFKARDAAGRNWTAEKLVGLLVKDFAYQGELDVQFALMRSSGTRLAQVTYADPSHENNGLVFSIDGGDGSHRTLKEIRQTIFHPNATAMVKPHV